jgi:16S rRNA (cytosine1402-N4)-methyltransferase
LAAEVVEALRVSPSSLVLDCTVGEGGHALAILEAGAPGCRLLGLDVDPQALETARERLKHLQNRVALAKASYVNATVLAERHGFLPLTGALMDLGISSQQLEHGERGFSFQRDGPLDMRFDPEGDITAEDIVNRSSEGELTRVIAEYGEEPRARRISRAIVRARPIRTTAHLARVVEGAVVGGRGRTHKATRTFQAIRIAVNNEIENLEVSINRVIQLLGPGGRLCVISYMSLEDRVVKQALRQASSGCICPPGIPECRCQRQPTVRLITKKPITPSLEEVQRNPRSRSGRLRVAERL